jgi:dihydrofolate reductase
MISIISAISANDRGIGKDNQLLWVLPEDMKHFKEITNGHPVIMGLNTWKSLPERFRPLPNRTNIVMVREGEYDAPGAIVVPSLESALEAAKQAPGGEESFVIGGGQAYASALPFADRLYLTLVEGEKEADVFFPEYEKEFTKIISDEPHETGGLKYRFVTLERA